MVDKQLIRKVNNEDLIGYSNDSTGLLKACHDFRQAIIQALSNLSSIRFSKFPKGSCGDTAPLLGLFLERNGFGIYDYVCGHEYKNNSDYTHAWLQKDKLVVDITGDQFSKRPEVYIGKKDAFYKKYSVSERDRHPYYTSITDVLKNDYLTICDKLKK